MQFNNDQNYDGYHKNNRHFIEEAKVNMGFFTAALSAFSYELNTYGDNHQEDDKKRLKMKPSLTNVSLWRHSH